jgi:hypothetical protein
MQQNPTRTLTRAFALTLLLAAASLAAACGGGPHNDASIVYISNGKLIRTPPGGEDLGTVTTFASISKTASISDSNDADGFPLTLAAGGLVVIAVESAGNVNPFVELYGPDGNFVAADDNSGIGLDSLLVGPLAAGDYTVVVWSSLDGPSGGNYSLTVTAGGGGGEDLDVIPAGTAKTSTVGQMFAGTDTNTFVFTLDAAGTVDIAVAQLTGGLADIGIQLADDKGNEIVFVDPADTANPVIVGQVLARGTYLIVVSNADTGGAGLYDLTVTAAP